MLALERPERRTKRERARSRSHFARVREVKKLKLRQSEWINRFLTVEGKPLNLHLRPWWILPYDLEYVRFPGDEYRRSSVIVAGRQVEKSSSLANKSLAEIQVPWTKILYVAPSNTQLSEFSFRRLDEVIDTSPRIKHMKDDEHWSVSRKAFTSVHSSITLRASYLTPDRVRGIPAEVLFIDEVQDIISDNIPVIRETLTHCDRVEGPIFRMLGTPKTYDNPLEYFWSQESTQNEWMVRCSSCTKWNEGMMEDNVGPDGLVCIKCGSKLNPFGTQGNKGQRLGAGWYRTGPSTADMEGFRIPQLLLPYSFSYNKKLFRKKWDELLYKCRRYPRPKLYNEVLGISYDSGDKPVTREDMKNACMPGEKLLNLDAPGARAPAMFRNGFVFCGVDWGLGDPSKTIFSAARYVEGIFEVFFLKEFTRRELDPEESIAEVLRLANALNANFIGLDWGLGHGMNSRIRKAFGYNKTFVYSHTNQRDKLKYDSSALTYITNRTAVMADVFYLIKEGTLKFRCSWDELRDRGFAGDFLNVFKETNVHGNLKYDHPRGTTDDTVHSILYAFLSSQAKYPRPDLQ